MIVDWIHAHQFAAGFITAALCWVAFCIAVGIAWVAKSSWDWM